MFEHPRDRSFTHRNRLLGGGSLSVAIHCVAGAAALFVSHVMPSPTPAKPMRSALTFIAAAPVVMPPPERTIVDMAALSPVAERREPEPLPVIEIPVVEKITMAAAPLNTVAPRPSPARPTVPEPRVHVGVFNEAAPVAPAAYPQRQLALAGFDDEAAMHALKRQTTSMALGAFESTAASNAPDRRSNTVIADAGFGKPSSDSHRSAQPRRVAEAGFGESEEVAVRTPQPKALKESGFSDTQVPSAPSAKPAAPTRRIDTPLEVLSKPSPSYSEKARAMRLEGEVSLEVEFCATGSVRVVRVIRGLGHGLDEEAIKAAERIRFKPAQSRGQAVDVRTTLHITFRLS